MTGPGEGKILLEDSKVFLIYARGKLKINADVYIHLKGYSYARVTHLDIEHPILDNIIPAGKGYFLKIYNYDDKLRIILKYPAKVSYDGKSFTIYSIEIIHQTFINLIGSGKYTITWVGGKYGGIYIGFRKKEIRKLEEIAREVYNFED